MINSFDIDGVIFMGDYDGVYPNKYDIIITGRSVDEKRETLDMLHKKGISNDLIFFNPVPFDEKTRESSGEHKARTIQLMLARGYEIGIHFEDDPIQAKVIRERVPNVNVVLLQHDLVEKENVRHYMNEETE